MSQIISVEGISKKFILSHESQERYQSLRDVISNKVKGLIKPRKSLQKVVEKEEFWALKDISFSVSKGDRLGIIGRNGAGKSTLLKILSRITEPTTGRIVINGRIASLLEVGTGFHPELTGRENIFLNGAILGMSRSEIRKKFDEIVEFAEVEKFLDTPVKRYSSGMYVRLAFAVAAHLEPEILVVDEVLAVGDAQFQKKCLGKMQDVSVNEGRTVLFVSHNMASLKALCDKGIYLDAGKIRYTGSITQAISEYLSQNSNSLTNSVKEYPLFDNLKLVDFSVDKHSYSNKEPLHYSIEIAASNTTINNLCLLIFNEVNERIAIIDLRHNDFVGKRIEKSLSIKAFIENISLVTGAYKLGLFVSNNDQSANFFDLIKFQIYDSPSDFIKYPVEVRGYIEVDNKVTQINLQ